MESDSANKLVAFFASDWFPLIGVAFALLVVWFLGGWGKGRSGDGGGSDGGSWSLFDGDGDGDGGGDGGGD